jgi:hypothetical protein
MHRATQKIHRATKKFRRFVLRMRNLSFKTVEIQARRFVLGSFISENFAVHEIP